MNDLETRALGAMMQDTAVHLIAVEAARARLRVAVKRAFARTLGEPAAFESMTFEPFERGERAIGHRRNQVFTVSPGGFLMVAWRCPRGHVRQPWMLLENLSDYGRFLAAGQRGCRECR